MIIAMVEPERPSAEQVLERVKAEQERASRGKLKVFLGAAPGVGKTYAMLRTGQQLAKEGVDVVVGVVETHGRRETDALLQGLERLPMRQVDHRGILLREFDLDAALGRRAALLLVDELAHTNAPGSRHEKRWQDVRELLDAGLDVATTLNIQHVESLNDVIAQITGVRVRETVPDAVLDLASEFVLVDLAPDDLLQRLRDGKVYLGTQARLAIENFFRKGNLIALRELALRVTAERVDAQMESWRKEQGISSPWPVGEKVLVCVGPAPRSAGLIRAARRMADALKSPWFAVTVATPALQSTSMARARVDENLRLAKSLGAEPVVLTGERVADEVLAFARRENVTKVVCGKPGRRAWREHFSPSVFEELVRGSGGIDVYLPRVDSSETPEEPVPTLRTRVELRPYLHATLIVAVGTGLAYAFRSALGLADIAMGSLLGIVIAAMRLGRGPSLLATLLTVLCYDFFFVPPVWTFVVEDLKHILTFAMMFFVALVTSTLASRLHAQLASGREQTLRLQKLYSLSRELASASDARQIAQVCTRHAVEAGFAGAAWLTRRGRGIEVLAEAGATFAHDAKEQGVALWVAERGQPAGRTTQTLAAAAGFHMPIRGVEKVFGVLTVTFPEHSALERPEGLLLIEQMVHQAALAIDRANLADDARRMLVEAETERLRSSLMDSVSHDLRTPLASITGASGALLADEGRLDAAARRDLLGTIHEEAERLSRFVGNLLDMARLQAGTLPLRRELHSIEELVGSAIAAARSQLRGHPVATQLDANLPLVPIDETLIRQVLLNLLDNAAKYSPANARIVVAASATGSQVVIDVQDQGPGFPPGEEQRVFEKFYRASAEVPGIGLGLTIAEGLVAAHGGTIEARNRPEGGASVRFTLPLTPPPPPRSAA